MQEQTAMDSSRPHTDTQVAPIRPPDPRPSLSVARPSELVDGRYRIVREIAGGGGGIVFEAEQTYTGARVALKTVNLMRAPRGAGARLLREARALGLVKHPNLVSVLDAGECPRHGPFVALELIEGRTLESFITSRSRLSIQDTVALVCQLAGALTALSERGIVHRDVKPANVLVVPGDGGPDRAVLIDLGIAALEREQTAARLTVAGEIIGTPEYMAPEQATSASPPDRRTDVYGLAALAYECLTGSTPHAGQLLQVIAHLLTETEPARMSRYRADVPPALEAAVRRALRHERAERWPDAASFARACVAAIGGAEPPLHIFAPWAPRPDAAWQAGARRKSPRIPYRAPARLVRPGGRATDVKLEDLSPGGALVTTSEDLSENAACLLKMALPLSGQIVMLPSLVRWVRERGRGRAAGLEFIELPDAARRELDLFLKPID